MSTATPTTVELITASWLITIADTQTAPSAALADHGVAVQEGRIIAVGSRNDLLKQFPFATEQHLDQHILAPGLINCHGHAAMTLLRGMADDFPLMTRLENHIWPIEAEMVDYAFVFDGTELAIAEMLLSGTTCFSDMYFFPDATAMAAEKWGIRAQINFPILDIPSAWADSAAEYFDKGLALADEYRHSRYVQSAFGPHAPYTVSEDSLSRIAILAEETDSNIHIHLHETASEISNSKQQYGCTPLQRLHRLGLVSPRLQAVHMTQIDSDDQALLRETGAAVIHCPSSNLKLASGYCPVTALAADGVRIGLGTDGAASNNTLNLFETLRSAALLAKHHTGDASALPAYQAMRMATLGGAEVLGLDSEIGSIEVGKRADIIAIDSRHPGLQPLHSPLSQLVYTEAASCVKQVWIDGQQRVYDGQLLGSDINAVFAKATEWHQRISSHSAANINSTA